MMTTKMSPPVAEITCASSMHPRGLTTPTYGMQRVGNIGSLGYYLPMVPDLNTYLCTSRSVRILYDACDVYGLGVREATDCQLVLHFVDLGASRGNRRLRSTFAGSSRMQLP
jgi:hypothetical protein